MTENENENEKLDRVMFHDFLLEEILKILTKVNDWLFAFGLVLLAIVAYLAFKDK